MKKPQIGDTVVYNDPVNEERIRGTVDWLGSAQFRITEESGAILLILYAQGDWETMKT